MDVVDAGAHLGEAGGVAAPLLRGPGDDGVEAAHAGRPAPVDPLLDAVVADDHVRRLVGLLRRHVPLEHVGRLDDVVVDADQDHVVDVHADPSPASCGHDVLGISIIQFSLPPPRGTSRPEITVRSRDDDRPGCVVRQPALRRSRQHLAGRHRAGAARVLPLWIPDVGGPVFEALDRLLDATTSIVVATGILNVWAHAPEETSTWWDGLDEGRRRRVMLGLGVSHAARIGETWGRPLAVMNDYLDALDAGGVPAARRCLAALGPRMLALARDRSAGAHTYLVTAEHTAEARTILGSSGLFVEQGVVLDTDPATARDVARGLARYMSLPNYSNNWKRLGFTDEDIESTSDRLVDALVAWGDADAIRASIDAHFAAGADHVCIQVIGAEPLPLAAWRALQPDRGGR